MLNLNDSYVKGLFSTEAPLADDLYVYANYERIEKEAEENGGRLTESKDFYGLRILQTLSKKVEGMSKAEIERIIITAKAAE